MRDVSCNYQNNPYCDALGGGKLSFLHHMELALTHMVCGFTNDTIWQNRYPTLIK